MPHLAALHQHHEKGHCWQRAALDDVPVQLVVDNSALSHVPGSTPAPVHPRKLNRTRRSGLSRFVSINLR